MALEFASKKETFPNYRKFETTLAGRPFVVETGKMCALSSGSCMVSYGDTRVLCNVTMSDKPREGIDFFPLSVDFEEKLYSVGRIPGSFMRREGRPGEKAVLTSRVIDRPIRPLFPKDMRNDVSVVMTVMSVDPVSYTHLTGLSTDTGCFKFTNTTARTHIVAAKLMEAGANTVKLNSLLFENKSRSRIALERFALENLEYYFEGRCALICLTREQIEASGVEPSELEGITAIPRMIEGVEVGLTMRQQPSGSYKASIRTTLGVDASAIAAHLGGGGHKQAAGCEILGSTDNAKAALLSEVEKVLCKGF